MHLKKFFLMLLMICASFSAYFLTPNKQMSQTKHNFDLEEIIPKTFNEWISIDQPINLIVNPQQELIIHQTYSQTLSRVYVNDKGYKIMLTIAYGSIQDRKMQVHRPEVCYTSQGFIVNHMVKDVIMYKSKPIPLMRLTAIHGDRIEPIVYWVLMGNKIVRGNLEQGFARVEYGLKGFVPDGLLFRVSSIDPNETNAFQVQTKFITGLLNNMHKDEKQYLIGQILQ